MSTSLFFSCSYRYRYIIYTFCTTTYNYTVCVVCACLYLNSLLLCTFDKGLLPLFGYRPFAFKLLYPREKSPSWINAHPLFASNSCRGGTTRSHDKPKGLWISLTCAWISFKTVYFDSGFGLACIFQEIHLMFLRSGWFIGLILMWNSFSTSFNHHLDIEIRPARWKPPTCTYVRTCE